MIGKVSVFSQSFLFNSYCWGKLGKFDSDAGNAGWGVISSAMPIR
jgi:hypothetical protein